MEREVGGGIRMGKTCKLKAVSFQCMTKFTTNKKKERKKKKESKKKEEEEEGPSLRQMDHFQLCTGPDRHHQSQITVLLCAKAPETL